MSGLRKRCVASCAISTYSKSRSRLVHELRRALTDAHERLPIAALLVHLLEVLDRLDVVLVVLEDALEALDRLGRVARLVEVHMARLSVELDLHRRVDMDLRLLDDRLDHVGPPLLPGVLLDRGVQLGELRPRLIGQLTDRLIGGRLVRSGLFFEVRLFFRHGCLHGPRAPGSSATAARNRESYWRFSGLRAYQDPPRSCAGKTTFLFSVVRCG